MSADTTAPRLAVEADLSLQTQDFRIHVATSVRGDAVIVKLPGESLPAVRDLGVWRLTDFAATWIAASGQKVIVEINGRESIELVARRNWVGSLLRLPVGVSVRDWASLRAFLFSR